MKNITKDKIRITIIFAVVIILLFAISYFINYATKKVFGFIERNEKTGTVYIDKGEYTEIVYIDGELVKIGNEKTKYENDFIGE